MEREIRQAVETGDHDDIQQVGEKVPKYKNMMPIFDTGGRDCVQREGRHSQVSQTTVCVREDLGLP